ncbi:hypothetical protein FH972_026307 [Carpinus fangiana]|uniref:Uncharacterized protein n=1 Tax=Carpinus fangiana TaxID=176857 RepID=A0A5N6L443_9ROSI|nr:hypothetical protein FH972_026307 [Carpinus fangiana]
MPSLQEIQKSNSLISTSLPAGLVAVFVGSTSGIGEYSMVQFAKHARSPRIYFVGRSQESADRLQSHMKTLNPEGTYTFIKADTALLKNVDDVCRDIKSKEKAINLLFISTGTLLFGTKTAEGLHMAASLVRYSRSRFVVNLLPELRAATSLRRVVSVFAGTKEGSVDTNDLPGWKVNLLATRGHAASSVTFSLEGLAKRAPDVTFIHDFPGPVKSNLIRGGEGAIVGAMKYLAKALGPLGLAIPNEECGDRHVFLATSAKYPAGKPGEKDAVAVALGDGQVVAKGSDGKTGSGVYTVDQHGEPQGAKVEALLADMRKNGVADKVCEEIQTEFLRITGVEAI